MEAKSEGESGGNGEADSVPFTLDMFKRVQKGLTKKAAVFEDVNVQSVSYCLLYTSVIALSSSRKGGMDDAALHTSVKNITRHLLETLPVAGENYMIVFKLIHDLCLGEVSLFPSDISLLEKNVKLGEKAGGEKKEVEEKGMEEGGGKDSTDSPHIATPTGPDTPTLLSADDDPKPKVDPRAEVSRLMKQLRSGKQDITPKPFPVPSTPPKKVEKKAWRKSLFVKSGPWTPEVPEEDPLVTVCRDVMEEMGVGNRLLKFCCELPILLNLSRGGNAFASSSDVGSTEEGDPGIAPLIKRLHDLRNAVESISLLLHTPNLLPPLSTTRLSTLADVLVGCFQAACQATVALSGLPAKKRETGVAGTTDSEKSKEGEIVPLLMAESLSSTEDLQVGVVSSVAELYGSLSYCAPPTSDTPTVARALTSSIVSITLKIYQKLLSFQLNSSAQRNLRTLFVYHTFSTLQPLLSAGKSAPRAEGIPGVAETGGIMKVLGGIKLSMPAVDLMVHAVEGVKFLCEEVGVAHKESEGKTVHLTPQGMDVGVVYTASDCVEMLLGYLPLYKDLFSLVIATFRKIQAHVSSSSGSSVSEDHTYKVSEPTEGGVVAYGGDGEGDIEMYSPSPVSTVSSSGEVGGVYTLFSDVVHSEDDLSGEEGDYARLSPNLLMSSLGLRFGYSDSTPAAPPPPPLPPRRPAATKKMKGKMNVPPRGIPRHHIGMDPKQSSQEMKKRKPVLFLHLASSTMKCLSSLCSGLVINKDTVIQKFIRESTQAEHVSCLAWLVQNLDAVISMLDSGSKKETSFGPELASIGADLMDVLQEMIVGGVIGRQYLQGVLLNELGLSAKCWPLRIPPASLTLLGLVLVCRMEEGQGKGGKDGDDPLAVNIWKGFLHSLEESACSEEDPDEDLDVTHLQLMLFVWHSFSFETRASLLTTCAQAVVKASMAKQQGIPISPLINCRLLMVLDYLLFQFNEPPPDLTDQVNSNLLQCTLIGARPVSRSAADTIGKTSANPVKVSCYSSELQLQYSTILSKPSTAASLLKDICNPLRQGVCLQEAGTSPRFYNVRLPHVPCEHGESEASEDGDVRVDSKVDEQACRLLLTLPTLPDETSGQTEGARRGYDQFITALVSMMGVGADYSNQNKKLDERVLLATASHQCFSLAISLLGTLPPSYRVLSALVEGEGLSLMNPEGACLLIHVLHSCMKFRMQHMDTEDITDTLLVTGYEVDEAEEMVAKVISVLDSPEHFKEQTTNVLEEFIKGDDSTMLPLVCIAALDLLLSLITRAALIVNEDMGEELSGDAKPKEEVESEQLMGRLERVELEFCTELCPILIQMAHKLLQYAHLYVCSSLGEEASPLDAPRQALDALLCLSGKSLMSPKDKPPYNSHLPECVNERLKVWEAALVIDPLEKKKLSMYDDIQVAVCMVNFLDLHFSAFSGSLTFSPCRGLKSSISSVLMILEYMTNIFHDHCEGPASENQFLLSLTNGMVPMSCDVMMEFAHAQLLKFVLSDLDYSASCAKGRVSCCLDVLRLPEMRECELMGTILADLFRLLVSMLQELSKDSISLFQFFFGKEQATSITDLLLLATLPSTSAEAVTQSLQFIMSVLTCAEKAKEEALDLVGPLTQISKLGSMPKELTAWLRRLVLGSSAEGSTEVRNNVALLRKLVDLLTSPGCKMDPTFGPAILSAILPLGSELMSSLCPSQNSMHASIFKDFFDCLVSLAGTNKSDGHLQLARAVVEWMPQCIQVTPVVVDAEGEEEDLGKRSEPSEGTSAKSLEQSLVPINHLFLYLSQLTTAVQFCSNVAEYTEKRGVAGEDDPLFDESDGGEEAGLTGTVGGADEEESAMEEEAEDKLCTFTLTQREFANQHWYHCHTCRLVNGSGVCTVCAKVCHKGHDLTYSKLGSFFCDCGAKKNGSCKALVKRSGAANDLSGTSQPPPFSDPPGSHGSVRGSRKRKKRQRQFKKQPPVVQEEVGKTAVSKEWVHPRKRRPSFPSLPVLKLTQHIEKYKSELKDFIDSSCLAEHSLSLLQRTLPAVVRGVDQATSSGCSQARKAMIQLHLADKKLEYTDSLMAATLGSQEGAFENVRLNFNDTQGAHIMRQLLSSHSITRVAMCALTSVRGKRQHLCVNHDKGKLTILQLFPILKQADSNRRKLTLTRLSTTSVPFTVLSMSHNPCNEDYLVVCGLTECQLLVINTSGQVTSRSLLHPSVDNVGYIVKALWVPGSQHELVLLSDSFVKIYDTRVDVISPTYYFILDEGSIKDATVAVSDEGKYVVVMTSKGNIFSQPIVPSVTANEGPVYFTVNLTVTHPSVAVAGPEGLVNGGGASVYYSQTLKMLFFSYFSGTTFIATTTPSFSETIKTSEVVLKSSPPAPPNSKTPGPALISWMEVQHHPGLVCAISKSTSNPVTLLIKPETIQIHELKALPNKAKVQGMVAMRQPPSTGELVPLRRTTLIILCEDGSLRIYVANTSSSTEFWLQPQFQPSSPLAVLRAHPCKKGRVAKKTENVKFPVDFFEHCQLSNDVEFLGSDILHIYNKQQVLHRLNSSGLYIANTKPTGFTVEVSNLQAATTAVVGVRVLLRAHSMEKTPSFIELFGRTHTVSLSSGTSRWMDIPFTRDESIQADKGFKINFGPSLDPSGVNFIDSIQVYVKSKDAFMWPDHPPPSASTATPSSKEGSSAVARGDGAAGSEVMPMVPNKGCSPLDSLACRAMVVLSNHFISVKQSQLPDIQELVSQGTTLMMYGVPFQLQYRYKFLLSSLATSTELYHKEKDKLQLSHVVQCLAQRHGKDSLMEPEYFQYLLLMLVSIGKARPHNLCLISSFLDNQLVQEMLSQEDIGPGYSNKDGAEESQEASEPTTAADSSSAADTSSLAAFIHLLNDLFWKIFVKRPANLAIAPVVNPGFAAVDLTVMCMTEVMWALVLQDTSLLDVVLTYTIKFLLAPDSHLCLSCSRVVMRMLKPKKEKVVKASGGECVSGGEGASGNDAMDVSLDDGVGEQSVVTEQADREEGQAEEERGEEEEAVEGFANVVVEGEGGGMDEPGGEEVGREWQPQLDLEVSSVIGSVRNCGPGS